MKETSMPLARVLEPEVMDTPEEAREYDAMDHSTVNRLFVSDLLAKGLVIGEVLDVGTGTALIPVELCQQTPDCKVVAADLSTYMLDLARYNIAIGNCEFRVLLCHVDAKGLPFEDERFQVVMSNSIIHHIPDPSLVLAESVRVCVPGGRLFFRDLARPDNAEALTKLVDTYAGGESEFARKMFADSLHAALTLEELQALVGQLGFAASTVSMTSDRHWTWSAAKP